MFKSKKLDLHQSVVFNLENNYFVNVSHNKFLLQLGLNSLDLLYAAERIELASFFPLDIVAH